MENFFFFKNATSKVGKFNCNNKCHILYLKIESRQLIDQRWSHVLSDCFSNNKENYLPYIKTSRDAFTW